MAGELSAFSTRLCTYIKSTGNSVRGFERSIGVSNGWVSDVKAKVDLNAMSEISRKYPELNISWLFTGEGEMIVKESVSDQRLLALCKHLVSIFEEREEAIKELAEAIKCIR